MLPILSAIHETYSISTEGAGLSDYPEDVKQGCRRDTELSGGLKVLVVRYRRKYYATNRLSLTAPEVRRHYRKRHEVEEVIRVLKSQLGLAACQAGYRRPQAEAGRPQPRAQEPHIALCLVAYLIVERERLDRGCTWRQVKRALIFHGSQSSLPALERVREAA